MFTSDPIAMEEEILLPFVGLDEDDDEEDEEEEVFCVTSVGWRSKG